MNLINLGVQEMSAKETVSIDGGIEHHYEYGGASYSGGESEESGFWDAVWDTAVAIAVAVVVS